MKTADEMLEDLGYYNKQNYLEHLDYYNEKLEKIISFRNNETFACLNFYDSYEEITILELQAINKKCQELGWLD